MFINYLVDEFVEFMVVHELALVHELSQFMTVHEQHMFMNKVQFHEQNKFMNSWTFMKVSFVVLGEYSWTVHEHVDECSWTFIVFCSRTFMNYSLMFMNSSWSSHRGENTVTADHVSSALWWSVTGAYTLKYWHIKCVVLCFKVIVWQFKCVHLYLNTIQIPHE